MASKTFSSGQVVALALTLFRKDCGVEANPENYPTLWREYLEDAKRAVQYDLAGLYAQEC